MIDKHLFMIAETIKEIGKIYKPGMVAMIKKDHPRSWSNVTEIEKKINGAALSGDTLKLTRELKNYLNAWKAFLTNDPFSGQDNLFSQKAASLP